MKLTHIKEISAFMLPFLLILILEGNALWALARISGEPLIALNEQREGALILERRERLIQGHLPHGYDIVFAGTSRTMADYAASEIARNLTERCKLTRSLTAYNLGNVSNYFDVFSPLTGDAEGFRVLVLEFAPHTFLHHKENTVEEKSYERYRNLIKRFETWTTGAAKHALGLDNMIQVNHGMIDMLYSKRHENNFSSRTFLYMLQGAKGYGQSIQPDGQVFYRAFMPDRTPGPLLQSLYGTELSAFQSIHLASPWDDIAWKAFTDIIRKFTVPGKQIIIMRPPVSSAMYSLENEMQAGTILRVREYLHSKGIPYIDMNPTPYYSTDMSHIDWYDTPLLAKDVARRLEKTIRWDTLFGPETRCKQ
jgi:hypothetical protein